VITENKSVPFKVSFDPNNSKITKIANRVKFNLQSISTSVFNINKDGKRYIVGAVTCQTIENIPKIPRGTLILKKYIGLFVVIGPDNKPQIIQGVELEKLGLGINWMVYFDTMFLDNPKTAIRLTGRSNTKIEFFVPYPYYATVTVPGQILYNLEENDDQITYKLTQKYGTNQDDENKYAGFVSCYTPQATYFAFYNPKNSY
jgi:hypothetical protein